MPDKDSNKVEVVYAGPFVQARLASEDYSTGSSRTVAGLAVRLRLDSIDQYHALEEGVICIHQRGEKDNSAVVGSIAAMDDIMARWYTRIREVKDDGA